MRALAFTALLLLCPDGGAYETDQFSNRLEPVADSTQVLNARVNASIAQIVANWRGPRDDARFVDKIYFDIGGVHWVDKLERWAMKSPEIDRLSTPRRDSIYGGHPLWATRVAAVFGVGPTIKVNDELIGSDKLGHFLSQGRKFWRRYQRFGSEAKAAEQSAFTERALFGQFTTGSYSNADLVANYEGYRFYRSLFEDDVVPGKPAILDWRDGAWVVQRPFDFSDHVNAYWDEALNVNHYDTLLYPHMRERLQTFCPEFQADPEAWSLNHEAPLKQRYVDLQLRDTSELRLDRLCRDRSTHVARHSR